MLFARSLPLLLAELALHCNLPKALLRLGIFVFHTFKLTPVSVLLLCKLTSIGRPILQVTGITGTVTGTVTEGAGVIGMRVYQWV